MLACRVVVLLLSLGSVQSLRARSSNPPEGEWQDFDSFLESEGNSSMLNDDIGSESHITCPVLNALVQNGDLETNGETVDAKTVLNALFRAGLNQPAYEGEALAPGMTQSNAFEYTAGIFLKNEAGDYRDSDGDLTLPIYNFPGTNHEHNSHTGITTQKGVAFDNAQWEMLAARADRKLANGGDCFSRDAWAQAMFFFESRNYNNLTGTRKIDNSKVRSDHAILKGGTWIIGGQLKKGAENGNALAGKRLVAGVSQVFNGMINLFWTGDYGNVDLYKARARQAETDEGKAGLSFPWLDENFCLPVGELKSLLINGTYPKSSGYGAMTKEEFKKGKVWKFPKSRCSATYYREGLYQGYSTADACIDGEPPLVKKSVVASWAARSAFLTTFGKKFWRR